MQNNISTNHLVLDNPVSGELPELSVVTAASGGGKTAIVNKSIEERSELVRFITTTCRPIREGEEVHGRDYYFVSPAEFQRKIKNGDFFEWNEVYPGCWYGAEFSELKRIVSTGKKAILVLDVEGALKFMGITKSDQIKLDTIKVKGIYIYSAKEDMIKRLFRDIEEGKRNDSPEKIAERIKRMDYELAQAVHFTDIVPNRENEMSLAVNTFLNFVISK